jgi:hypothetical protein
MVPVASSASLAAKAGPGWTSPAILKVDEQATPQQAEIVTAESSGDEDVVAMKMAAQVTVTPIAVTDFPVKKAGRRTSRITRFNELEPIRSHTITTIEATPTPETTKDRKNKRRPTSTTAALPTNFDESSLPAPKEFDLPLSAPVSKPGKLSKNAALTDAGKPAKKHRWSLRSSKPTAVAAA